MEVVMVRRAFPWLLTLHLLAFLPWSAAGAEFESVEVSIPADSVRLAATLYTPRATASDAGTPEHREARAGVVVLHGSGTNDRAELRHAGFLDCLLDAGLVVLDFDKRGIGGSGGSYSDAPDLTERAADGDAAVRFLRGRPEVDPGRVGIWGISQGGWVGEIMAARDPSLAFAILVSAPGVSPVMQTLYQRMEELREGGEWTDAELAAAYPVRAVLWRYYQTGEGRDQLEAMWAASRASSWFQKLKWGEAPPDRGQLNSEQRSFFTRHGAYEPAGDLRAISIPLLCFFGGKDRHIPVDDSIAAMRAAFATNPRSRATIELLPEAGHGMQQVDGPSESVTEMKARHAGGQSMPDLTFDPDYCPRLHRWLREVAVLR
ncbi:MAG: alpha/beta hydrolase [Candidatus Eisenbacteria bacterium]